MRRFTRLLFSRYGMVGAIVLLIIVVLTVARIFGGPADRGGAGTQAESNDPSVVHAPDDGVAHSSGLPTAEPEPSLNPEAEHILTVAQKFAENWAQPDKALKAWHDDLAPLSTVELNAELKDVDPIAVPTDQLIGEGALSFQRGELAEVTVSAVGGTLRLSLAVVNGRWLVSGVDWERG